MLLKFYFVVLICSVALNKSMGTEKTVDVSPIILRCTHLFFLSSLTSILLLTFCIICNTFGTNTSNTIKCNIHFTWRAKCVNASTNSIMAAEHKSRAQSHFHGNWKWKCSLYVGSYNRMHANQTNVREKKRLYTIHIYLKYIFQIKCKQRYERYGKNEWVSEWVNENNTIRRSWSF